MKHRLGWIPIVFLLVACKNSMPTAQPPSAKATEPLSPTTVNQAILDTSKGTPFATLTPDEITTLDLGSILVQPGDLPGDLPEDYTGGEVIDKVPYYIDLQGATCEYQRYQGFQQNAESAGGVTLVECIDGTDGQAIFSIGYDMMGWGDVQSQVQDIGEYMLLGTRDTNSRGGLAGMDVLFNRCGAVVHIRINGSVEQETILSYAKKLDERLTPLVCP